MSAIIQIRFNCLSGWLTRIDFTYREQVMLEVINLGAFEETAACSRFELLRGAGRIDRTSRGEWQRKDQFGADSLWSGHAGCGEVRWQGKNIRSLGEEYFRDVAYLAHQNGVKDELSAIENLRISSAVSGHALKRDRAQHILGRIGLNSQQNLPARSLSAGQRRRLALARLLTSNAKFWILDEVLTSLDDAAVQLSGQFIDDHLKNGGLAIIATHQELNLSAPRVQRIELSK